MLAGKRILLVISGGIAAYKALELIRRLKDRGVAVRAILTRGGAEFITPLSVAALVLRSMVLSRSSRKSSGPLARLERAEAHEQRQDGD